MKRRWQGWIISMVFALVLTLVTPVTTYAVSGSELHNPKRNEETHETGGTHKTDFSYVYFGMYPQREIKGSEITDAIRNAKYDEYGDAVVNGRKYRRLTFEMMSRYGTINQRAPEYVWTPYSDNGYRYFLYEPIRWKVLNCDDGVAFLFADLVLDTQAYNCENSPVDWKDCTIREWLNSDGCITNGSSAAYKYRTKGFYGTAFDNVEKSRIVETTTKSCDNPTYPDENFVSVSTKDKVFLLSFEEITSEKYGFCKSYYPHLSKPEDRYQCDAMAIPDPESEYPIALYGTNLGQLASSWLRTEGKYPHQATFLDLVSYYRDSSINMQGMAVSFSLIGVAPAINVSYSLSDCIKVNFVTNGAGTVDSEILLGSGYAKEPDRLQRNNYYFTGWYTDAACTQKYNFNSKVTKDLTLYAGWKPYVAVTFHTNGGSTVKTQSIVQGTKLSEPAKPTKEDYVFTGWYTDAACTKLYNFNQTVDTNVTLYAGWKVRDLNLNEKISYEGGSYQVTDPSTKSVEYRGPGKSTVTTVTIPEKVTFKGVSYNVTAIQKNAFKNCQKLKKITIPKGVTSIGSNAFYGCKKLTTVTFKGVSVKTIGAGAFRNCASLKKITIPKGVTSIGSNAFYGCKKLTTVTFKGVSVKTIGAGAFRNCASLKKITIPKGVTSIGKDAFRNCKKLNKITIKSTTLKKIGSKAFTNINKKAKFIVPKKKLKPYKKLLKKTTGYKSSMRIKK